MTHHVSHFDASGIQQRNNVASKILYAVGPDLMWGVRRAVPPLIERQGAQAGVVQSGQDLVPGARILGESVQQDNGRSVETPDVVD